MSGFGAFRIEADQPTRRFLNSGTRTAAAGRQRPFQGPGAHYRRCQRWSVGMMCPCGATIEMLVFDGAKPRWDIAVDANGRPTLRPSVWRNTGCRSHFGCARAGLFGAAILKRPSRSDHPDRSNEPGSLADCQKAVTPLERQSPPRCHAAY